MAESNTFHDELTEDQKNQHHIFSHFDMLNDQPDVVNRDLSFIRMIPLRYGNTDVDTCQPHMFARVHWTARLAVNGHLVEDSKKKYGINFPREFKIGSH